MRIDTYYIKDLESISFKENGKKKVDYLITHAEPYDIKDDPNLFQ